MISIGGLGGAPHGIIHTRASPEARMQAELQNLTETGGITSEDKEALSGALSEIGNDLHKSRPEIDSKPPSKEEVQEKIDSLINQQVDEGALTEDQAEKLSAMFQKMAETAPPPPPPDRGGEENTFRKKEGDIANILEGFLEKIQKQNATSYSPAGTTQGGVSILFDFSA